MISEIFLIKFIAVGGLKITLFLFEEDHNFRTELLKMVLIVKPWLPRVCS